MKVTSSRVTVLPGKTVSAMLVRQPRFVFPTLIAGAKEFWVSVLPLNRPGKAALSSLATVMFPGSATPSTVQLRPVAVSLAKVAVVRVQPSKLVEAMTAAPAEPTKIAGVSSADKKSFL